MCLNSEVFKKTRDFHLFEESGHWNSSLMGELRSLYFGSVFEEWPNLVTWFFRQAQQKELQGFLPSVTKFVPMKILYKVNVEPKCWPMLGPCLLLLGCYLVATFPSQKKWPNSETSSVRRRKFSKGVSSVSWGSIMNFLMAHRSKQWARTLGQSISKYSFSIFLDEKLRFLFRKIHEFRWDEMKCQVWNPPREWFLWPTVF